MYKIIKTVLLLIIKIITMLKNYKIKLIRGINITKKCSISTKVHKLYQNRIKVYNCTKSVEKVYDKFIKKYKKCIRVQKKVLKVRTEMYKTVFRKQG